MKSRFLWKALLFFLLSTALLLTLAYLFRAIAPKEETEGEASITSAMPTYTTVILDAGHGGEDGGASSASGLLEKELNLDVAIKLCRMLRASGIEVIMTREDDRLLYDPNSDYHGQKKKQDLAARLAVTEQTEGAVLVSIHMNYFPDSRYSGLQVWYSVGNADSLLLADTIQSYARLHLQPDNKRQTKAASSSIFLLHKAKCPAVLVECGFLSNEAEAQRLSSEEYRQKVAFALFCSITEFLGR